MSEEPCKARLIDDRGRSAESEEFFRSRPFFDAEKVTHTLQLEAKGGSIRAPMIVRPIGNGPEEDASSPYGFPGLSPAAAAAIDPAAIDFSETGLVAIFLRHSLGTPPLRATTDRSRVFIVDPSLPFSFGRSDGRQIRKNKRERYRTKIAHGPRTSSQERASFHELYMETMIYRKATDRYRYDPGYFDCLLDSDRAWLVYAIAPDGEMAAGSFVVHSDGFIHYYLSGTRDAYRHDAPMKNVIGRLIEVSQSKSLPLNLGGGMSAGDKLERFKRGFSNAELWWHTSELICDPVTYDRLSGDASDSSGFFPAYRASVANRSAAAQ